MLEIKRDTAVFGPRQWYVDGYEMHWFTTREDAVTAVALAGQYAEHKVNELADKIREALQ
jgi:hypothetical protein